VLLFASAVYFAHVFIDKDKRDISFLAKLILFLICLPIFIILPTQLSIKYFDLSICEGVPAFTWYYYMYALEIVSIFWIIFICIRKYRSLPHNDPSKKQIPYFAVGISSFLALFVGSNLIGQITSIQEISFIGSIGMVIFIGFLAYLIVEYKAFNVKLLRAQALIVAMLVLIASQFFFIQNNINRILTAATLIMFSIFGWWLAKSVKKEDEQNESLTELNKIITKQKNKIERDKKAVEAANEELVKLDKAKTEFINIASHQLKTPISVIQGVASMMIEGDMDKMPLEQRQTFYNSVWQKTKKLKIIVHDILNATSFNDQKYSVMDNFAVMINVPELLQQIITDFGMEIKERGIDVTFSSEENLPEVKGQKEYLEEALINLINNAIKYTPSSVMTRDVRGKRKGDERGIVAVSVGKDPENPKNILIKVKDNGIGIPEEAKAKLFKRFSRAENAVNMYTDGTGLGLFIVKEIVSGHRGKVWFESEVGKGTTFFVSLPFIPEGTVNIKEHITEDAAANATV